MHKRFVTFQGWAIFLAIGSGLLILTSLLLNRFNLLASSQVNASTLQSEAQIASQKPNLGPRYQLTYGQWVQLLQREAKVAAEEQPPHLIVLAGDSLSLWFPQELLPPNHTWLNQGISGETSYGLLRRLELFDKTQPEAILVMIGINDLIHGVSEETLLANHREIVRHLKAVHPQSKIIVQSILPHGGNLFLNERYRSLVKQDYQPPHWVDRLRELPNSYIRELNEKIAAIAKEEKVEYLDLHPYFTDDQGDMMVELTTDGLHLSAQGYQVWRSRLETLNQVSDQASK